MARAAPRPVRLDLALQGGGAHGAFTWGVLDRLLDERIEVSGISGASAGAMNAVVLADGWLSGGAAGARSALWRFWKRISRAARRHSPFRTPFAAVFPPGLVWTGEAAMRLFVAPWAAALQTMAGNPSPYQFNPLNLNPLLDILRDSVDFARLRAAESPRLLIAATDLRSGEMRLFRNAELTAEAVMASACLPNLFQAVEIEGNAYWDGGYLANPPLFPLLHEAGADDLLLVQLNPPRREAVPRDTDAIMARLNEVTFNAGLVRDMRGLALLREALVAEGEDHEFRNPFFARVKRLRLHRIAASEDDIRLRPGSKLDPEWGALIRLHGLGSRAAETWLEGLGASLGRQSTLGREAG
ncbi:patatin-like phospholipase family protein [Sabulicella rubraurantiaca]|uniref:patatin-like phospholipase family protein n=1 Tax=Sabulicella rubraurantiaca TaxID=2811429 RepID=UPI001A96BD81|nr:patatin-like phospholipase family protein [Sabulicella rubraurantiaca]